MTRFERESQLVRAVEVNLGKLSDPDMELPLELVERLQRALLKGHDANLMRLLKKSVEARAVDAVGASA